MTPERAKELLPIITAYANGETIEIAQIDHDVWTTYSEHYFNERHAKYRVKPKVPEYRLFCYFDGTIIAAHRNTGIPREAADVIFKEARVADRTGRWLTDWLPIPNYPE